MQARRRAVEADIAGDRLFRGERVEAGRVRALVHEAALGEHPHHFRLERLHGERLSLLGRRLFSRLRCAWGGPNARCGRRKKAAPGAPPQFADRQSGQHFLSFFISGVHLPGSPVLPFWTSGCLPPFGVIEPVFSCGTGRGRRSRRHRDWRPPRAWRRRSLP